MNTTKRGSTTVRTTRIIRFSIGQITRMGGTVPIRFGGKDYTCTYVNPTTLHGGPWFHTLEGVRLPAKECTVRKTTVNSFTTQMGVSQWVLNKLPLYK